MTGRQSIEVSRDGAEEMARRAFAREARRLRQVIAGRSKIPLSRLADELARALKGSGNAVRCRQTHID
jgi:hypothetical protein